VLNEARIANIDALNDRPRSFIRQRRQVSYVCTGALVNDRASISSRIA